MKLILSKAREGLVPVKRRVMRNGKSFMQTFYIRPEEVKKDPAMSKDIVNEEIYTKTEIPSNRPEGGLYIATSGDVQSREAVKVPPEMISHAFKLYGHTFVVHKSLMTAEGENDKAWQDDKWNVVEVSTGLNIAFAQDSILDAVNLALTVLAKNREIAESTLKNSRRITDLSILKREYRKISIETERENQRNEILKVLEVVGNQHWESPELMDIARYSKDEFEASLAILNYMVFNDTKEKFDAVIRISSMFSLNLVDSYKAYFLNTMIIEDMKETIKLPIPNLDLNLNTYLDWLDRFSIDPLDIKLNTFAVIFDSEHSDNISGQKIMAMAFIKGESPYELQGNMYIALKSQHEKKIAESVPYLLGVDSEKRLDMLEQGNVVSKDELFGQGVNGAYKTTFNSDGSDIVGLWKPSDEEHPCRVSSGILTGTYYIREAMAYELSKTLGSDLIPPTAIRDIDGEVGSVQEWHFGCVNYAVTEVSLDIPEDRQIDASVMDYLMGNTDRHDNNYMVNVDSGDLVLIDNGLCFPSNDRVYRFTDTAFYQEGSLSNKSIDRLNKINWSSFLKVMDQSELPTEAVFKFEQRLQWMFNTESLPSRYEVEGNDWSTTEVTTDFRGSEI